MNGKTRLKSLKTVTLIVLSALFIGMFGAVGTKAFATPVESDDFVLSGEISEYYGYLSIVNFPSATYGGNAATGKVIAPDGTESGITGYRIEQFGTHTVRYSYSESTNEYYKDYAFGVKRLPINVVSEGETDSFSSYCMQYPVSSVISSEGSVDNTALYYAGAGIEVHLKAGEYAESMALDMSNAVGYKSDQERTSIGVPDMSEVQVRTPVFAFAFLPQVIKQGYADENFDAMSMTVDFIDANGNIFSVRNYNMWDAGYQSSSYNGDSLTTYQWINLEMIGYNGDSFGTHILIGRIYYDAAAKAFLIANGGANCSAFLGTAPDFDDTNVRVRVTFGDYVKDSAGVFVFNLNGMTGNGLFSYNDEEPPVINIDYGGYLKDSLPVYPVGERFTFFAADVFDEYTLSSDYTVKVFYGDDEIPTENGGFTPSVSGDYTLVYVAEDVFGNRAEERVTINVGIFISETDITDLTVSYGGKNGLTYGDTLKIATISGGKAYFGETEISGRFAFVDENLMPLPTANGKSTVYITFISDTQGYFFERPIAIEISVAKYVPQVKTEVTAKSMVKSVAELNDPTGEFFDENGGVLQGSLVWKNKEMVSGVNTLTWEFTPYNTDVYETVSGTLQVTLNGGGSNASESKGGCSGSIGAGNTLSIIAVLLFCASLAVVKYRVKSREEK